MSYIIFILLGIFAFIFKKNKIVFSYIFLFALVLMGLNFANPDYENYKLMFETGRSEYSSILELFFSLILRILAKCGMNYQTAYFVIAFTGLFLIFKTIYDYSPYRTYSILLYLIYPYIFDVCQLRSFLADALMVYSCRYLIDYRLGKETKKNICCFLFFWLMACGCHTSSLLFAILILIFFDIKYKNITYIGIIVTMILLAIKIQDIIPYLYFFIHHKVNWLGQKISGISYKYILRILLFRLNYFVLIFLFKKNIKINKHSLKKDYESLIINETLFETIKYIICIIIFEIFFDPEFERLLRPAFIFSYILIARLMINITRFNRILFMMLFLILIAVYVTSMLFLQTGGDLNPVLLFYGLFRKVFENNLLFSNILPL